jgi:4-amino-4-deoxy-L-arabinose transferase-like glycosyltransferase
MRRIFPYLRQLRSELNSALIVATGIAGLFLFLTDLFGLGSIFEEQSYGWFFSVGISLIVGTLVFLAESYLIHHLFANRADGILAKVTLLHLPLIVLGVHLLDLRIQIFNHKFPPFNQSLFYIFGVLCIVCISRVLLSEKHFAYVKRVLKYLFGVLVTLYLIRSIPSQQLISLLGKPLELFSVQSITARNVAIHLSDLVKIFDINLVTATGLITLFLHRRDIKAVEEKDREKRDERALSKGDFCRRYPTLSRLPVLGFFAWRAAREGLVVSALLVALIVLGGYHICYRLGYQDFYNDEFHTLSAAKGFVKTGTFQTWRWYEDEHSNLTEGKHDRMYPRAWPHTLLVAASLYAFGDSEWAARLPSALLGLLFYFLVYLFGRQLWGDRWSALLMVAVLAFSEPALTIFRFTRMYAMLMVCTLLAFWFIFKWLDETQKIDLRPLWFKRFCARFFDFNLGAMFVAIALIFFGYILHVNILILLPFILAYAVWLLLSERSPRYLLLVIFGGLAAFGAYLLIEKTDYLQKFTSMLTYFEKRQFGYQDYFFKFPAGYAFTCIMTGIGLGMMCFDLRPRRRRLLSAFLILTAIGLVFFVWIADRWVAPRYAYHVIVLFQLCLVGTFATLTTIYPRPLRWLLAGLLVFVVYTNFESGRKILYEEGSRYGRLSSGYGKIVNEIDPEEEVVFALYHDIYSYYLKDIPPQTKFIDLKNNRQHRLDDLLKELHRHKAGWLVWPHYKQYHFRRELVKYIRRTFRNESPRGSKIDLFYYDRNMMKDSVYDVVNGTVRLATVSDGKIDRAFSGNFAMVNKIDLKRPFSLALWIMFHRVERRFPVSFDGGFRGGIRLSPTVDQSEKGYEFRYAARGPGSHVSTGPLGIGRWHHLVFYQHEGKPGLEYGVYLDGKKVAASHIPSERTATGHFRMRKFDGKIEDIRIYRKALTSAEVTQIYSEGRGTKKTTLKIGNTAFTPIEHWQSIEIDKKPSQKRE